ncbi:MAG: MBL fold metallo-hydrolase [Elusimicrobia bacterium]|nr:MBL fold metallo-hydrolase [Elusimicrobiota bacterium]
MSDEVASKNRPNAAPHGFVKRLTVRIVTENHAGAGDLVPEHGLCLWIEADEDVILFDTGQGQALLQNAARMGLDLGRVTCLVLSHGHYDHSGGVGAALKATNRPVPVYLHAQARKERFSRSTGKTRSIGMPEEAQAALFQLSPKNLFETDGPVRVRPGVWATGSIPRTREPEGLDRHLFVLGNRRDDVEDDQALLVRTTGGNVIMTGCGHAGVGNTLDFARTLVPGAVRAVIGGFHLSRAGRSRWVMARDALVRHAVGEIIPCHCTGEEATRFLTDQWGSRCRAARAGDVFVF